MWAVFASRLIRTITSTTVNSLKVVEAFGFCQVVLMEKHQNQVGTKLVSLSRFLQMLLRASTNLKSPRRIQCMCSHKIIDPKFLCSEFIDFRNSLLKQKSDNRFSNEKINYYIGNN